MTTKQQELPDRWYLVSERRLQKLDDDCYIDPEFLTEVRSRPRKYHPADENWVLKQVKHHLDAVLNGELPCGEDDRSYSSYCAIRALIERLEMMEQK